VAVIVDAATVLGALATVAGVLIAFRGQRHRTPSARDRAEASGRGVEVRSDLATPPGYYWELEAPSNAGINRSEPVSARTGNFDVVLHRVQTGGSKEVIGTIVLKQISVRGALAAGRVGTRPRWPARGQRRAAKADVPGWAIGLMSARDGGRYASEWGAHLCQLIEEGELGQARRDRRRLALAAIFLAVTLRLRRALGRALSAAGRRAGGELMRGPRRARAR
jgi:hypothetical protein